MLDHMSQEPLLGIYFLKRNGHLVNRKNMSFANCPSCDLQYSANSAWGQPVLSVAAGLSQIILESSSFVN